MTPHILRRVSPRAWLAAAAAAAVTAWRSIPSWAVVGLEDRAIPADRQLFMANRAGARIVKVHASHVAMISQPDDVTRVIESAVRATD